MRHRFALKGLGSRAPLGLIGALALIVLVEGEIRRREPIFFTTVWAADWRETGRTAAREAVPARVLCFGDSLTKFGLSPKAIEAELGLPTHNLALNAGHAGASYFLLKRALDAGARPDVVLVDFAPHLIAEPPQAATRQWPELVDGSDRTRLIADTLDVSFAAELISRSFVPSIRTRDELRDYFKAEAEGKLPDNAYAVPRMRRHWRENLGAQLLERAGPPRLTPEVLKSVCTATWAPDPIADRHVRAFLELASRASPRVFILIPPLTPDLQARRAATGLDRAYDAYLRELLARYPTVRVIDGRGFVATDDWHCDAVHLSDKGAAAFSRAVATAAANPSENADSFIRLGPIEPQTPVADRAEAEAARRR